MLTSIFSICTKTYYIPFLTYIVNHANNQVRHTKKYIYANMPQKQKFCNNARIWPIRFLQQEVSPKKNLFCIKSQCSPNIQKKSKQNKIQINILYSKISRVLITCFLLHLNTVRSISLIN